MRAAKIGLPILLVGGAAAALLLSSKSEASEGGTRTGSPPPPPTGGPPADSGTGIVGGSGPANADLERLARAGRVAVILADLAERAQGAGLLVEDVEVIIRGLELRYMPANLERILVSMESLELLIPLIANLNPAIVPPAAARSVPRLTDTDDVADVQAALNAIEVRMIEASLVQEALWFRAWVPGFEGRELSSQFGSSVFVTYVTQLQQIKTLDLVNRTARPFLSAAGGRLCGQRGQAVAAAGIGWNAVGGIIRMDRAAPQVPVDLAGWGASYFPSGPAYRRTVADNSWPLIVDGVQGACTDYAQSVIFAAATYAGLPDVASGITGMDPRTGNLSPSYFDPMGVVAAIDNDPIIAHHLAIGYRAMKAAGLLQWDYRTPGP